MSTRLLIGPSLLVICAGCGGTPSTPPPPAKGSAVLTFACSKSVRTNPSLMSPLKGTIWGNVYHTSDTTLTGPTKDAKAVANIKIENVDLTADASTTAPVDVKDLDPDNYIFLGMFDVNGNADPNDASPDTGDPVTLPINKFDVTSSTATKYTVNFDLVYSK